MNSYRSFIFLKIYIASSNLIKVYIDQNFKATILLIECQVQILALTNLR